MEEFKAATINELEKLYKKKKLLISGIISLIFIIIGQFAVLGVRNGFGIRGASSSEFPLLVLSLIVNTILPLFTALVTIDSFSSEFSHNTMKISITRPISRFKFFSAKILSIIVFISLNLLFVMVFSTVIGAICNSNSFTFLEILKVPLCYIVTIFPMIILSLFITILANTFKSGTSTFFLSVLIFIAFKVLEVILLKYSGIFFTSMFSWYNLWIIDGFPLMTIFRQFLLMLSYGILFFTFGYYLFDKKEF